MPTSNSRLLAAAAAVCVLTGGGLGGAGALADDVVPIGTYSEPNVAFTGIASAPPAASPAALFAVDGGTQLLMLDGEAGDLVAKASALPGLKLAAVIADPFANGDVYAADANVLVRFRHTAASVVYKQTYVFPPWAGGAGNGGGTEVAAIRFGHPASEVFVLLKGSGVRRVAVGSTTPIQQTSHYDDPGLADFVVDTSVGGSADAGRTPRGYAVSNTPQGAAVISIDLSDPLAMSPVDALTVSTSAAVCLAVDSAKSHVVIVALVGGVLEFLTPDNTAIHKLSVARTVPLDPGFGEPMAIVVISSLAYVTGTASQLAVVDVQQVVQGDPRSRAAPAIRYLPTPLGSSAAAHGLVAVGRGRSSSDAVRLAYLDAAPSEGVKVYDVIPERPTMMPPPSAAPWTDAPTPPTGAPNGVTPEALEKIDNVETAAVGAVVGIVVAGGGASAGEGGRLVLISQLCEPHAHDIIADGHVGAAHGKSRFDNVVLNPLGMTVGGSDAVGTLVGNHILVLAIGVVWGGLIHLAKRHPFMHQRMMVKTSALNFACSATALAYQCVYPGIAMAALELVVYPRSLWHGVIGGTNVLIAVVVPTALALRMRAAVPSKAVFVEDDVRNRGLHPVLLTLVGPGEWVDVLPPGGFVARWSSILRRYREHAPHGFFLTEFCLTFATAGIRTVDANTFDGCGHKKLATAIIIVLALIAEVLVQAPIRRVYFGLTFFALSLQTVAMVLVGLSYYAHDIGHPTFVPGNTLLVVSAVVLGIRGLLEVLPLVYGVFSGRKKRLQDQIFSTTAPWLADKAVDAANTSANGAGAGGRAAGAPPNGGNHRSSGGHASQTVSLFAVISDEDDDGGDGAGTGGSASVSPQGASASSWGRRVGLNKRPAPSPLNMEGMGLDMSAGGVPHEAARRRRSAAGVATPKSVALTPSTRQRSGSAMDGGEGITLPALPAPTSKTRRRMNSRKGAGGGSTGSGGPPLAGPTHSTGGHSSAFDAAVGVRSPLSPELAPMNTSLHLNDPAGTFASSFGSTSNAPTPTGAAAGGQPRLASMQREPREESTGVHSLADFAVGLGADGGKCMTPRMSAAAAVAAAATAGRARSGSPSPRSTDGHGTDPFAGVSPRKRAGGGGGGRKPLKGAAASTFGTADSDMLLAAPAVSPPCRRGTDASAAGAHTPTHRGGGRRVSSPAPRYRRPSMVGTDNHFIAMPQGLEPMKSTSPPPSPTPRLTTSPAARVASPSSHVRTPRKLRAAGGVRRESAHGGGRHGGMIETDEHFTLLA